MVSVKHIRYRGKKRLPPVYRPTEAYSYTIFKKGNKYYAKNGETKEVEYKGSDAGEVIQLCIDALGEMGGSIFIKSGIYDLYSPLTINDKYVWICGEGRGVQYHDVGTVLKKHFDGDLISISYSDLNRSGFIIEKLKIEGNRTEHTGGGISISKARGWLLRDVIIRNCGGSALHVENCGWHNLVNVFFGACDDHIIYYKATGDWMWVHVTACTVMTDDKDAVYLHGSSGQIVCSHFESGKEHGRHGIYALWCTSVIVGNFIGFCGYHGIYLDRSPRSVVIGNRFVDVNCRDLSEGSYISIESKYCVVIGNVFERGSSDYGHPKYNVRVTRDDNIVAYNYFIPDPEVSAVLDTGSRNRFKGNINYPTENKGVATITGDGTTTTFTVDIAHGLAKDKVVCKITLDRDGTIDKVYLVDTEPDGFYETVRVQVTYASAPASGEEVPIYWSAEVVE